MTISCVSAGNLADNATDIVGCQNDDVLEEGHISGYDSLNTTYASHNYVNYSYHNPNEDYWYFFQCYKYDDDGHKFSIVNRGLLNSGNFSFDSYGLDAGKYNLVLEEKYWDNDITGGWTDTTTYSSRTLYVQKAQSNISIGSYTTQSGKLTEITAHIAIPNVNPEDRIHPVSSDEDEGEVIFTINNVNYTSKISNGVAKLKFNAPVNVKTYSCGVFYNGNGNVLGSSKDFKLNVKKAASKITVKSFEVYSGKKYTVKATVLYKHGAKVTQGKVKFKINGKTYNVKVEKGIAKIKITAPKKVKKYSCTASYINNNNIGGSSAKFKMTVIPAPTKVETNKKSTSKSSKSSSSSVTMNIKVNSMYYSKAKLNTGDVLLGSANSYTRQHPKGIFIGTKIDAGQEFQHSTKLIKAKVWFKNKKTGKVITRTQTAESNGYNIKKISWIDGYTPYKAQIWYKHR